MKKLFDYLHVLLILVATSDISSAQDFKVEIPTTDKYASYIKPLKPGATHQLQIKVINNRQDTCTVSIDKFFMGEIGTWISTGNYPKKSAFSVSSVSSVFKNLK